VDVSKAQRKVCERCGVPPTPPASKSTIGLAPAASVLLPLNALRHPPEGHSSGWFVWRGGEIPEDQDDFFKPVHIEHLEQHEPDLLPYLALPPGWRVLLAPDQEDVWYDEQLLRV
jgi:hypothetical protein